MDDFKFYTVCRVRFCETDLQGILHHSDYLKYFEVARVEYMRNLGLVENNDFVGDATVTVVESGCSHKNTLKFDDEFKIYVRVSELRGARITFEYKILKASDESLIADGFTKTATVDRKNFTPTRVPKLLSEKISEFEKP